MGNNNKKNNNNSKNSNNRRSNIRSFVRKKERERQWEETYCRLVLPIRRRGRRRRTTTATATTGEVRVVHSFNRSKERERERETVIGNELPTSIADINTFFTKETKKKKKKNHNGNINNNNRRSKSRSFIQSFERERETVIGNELPTSIADTNTFFTKETKK